MAKYYGKIGYVFQEEIKPGYVEERVEEHVHYGDILRNTRRWDAADKIVDDFHIANQISILADSYAINHASAMRYVHYIGSKWVISKIDIEQPRIILTLGGLYNGPEPDSDSGEMGETS